MEFAAPLVRGKMKKPFVEERCFTSDIKYRWEHKNECWILKGVDYADPESVTIRSTPSTFSSSALLCISRLIPEDSISRCLDGSCNGRFWRERIQPSSCQMASPEVGEFPPWFELP